MSTESPQPGTQIAASDIEAAYNAACGFLSRSYDILAAVHGDQPLGWEGWSDKEVIERARGTYDSLAARFDADIRSIEKVMPFLPLGSDASKVSSVSAPTMHQAAAGLANRIFKTAFRIPFANPKPDLFGVDLPRVRELLLSSPMFDFELAFGEIRWERDVALKSGLLVREVEQGMGSATDGPIVVNISGNKITVDGRTCEDVSPHICEIIAELNRNAGHYIKGDDLKLLPGCKGKNVSRDLIAFKRDFPAIEKYLPKGTNEGYKIVYPR